MKRMNRFELLNTIHQRNITFQQLVAYVTKASAVNHSILIQQASSGASHNASSASTSLQPSSSSATPVNTAPKIADPNRAFAEVLSNLEDKSVLKRSQYQMSHGKLFEGGNTKKPLLKEIDVGGLDSSFLLNLLTRTNFLDISAKQGTCCRSHSDRCCGDCNKRCKNCNKNKNECKEFSLICYNAVSYTHLTLPTICSV